MIITQVNSGLPSTLHGQQLSVLVGGCWYWTAGLLGCLVNDCSGRGVDLLCICIIIISSSGHRTGEEWFYTKNTYHSLQTVHNERPWFLLEYSLNFCIQVVVVLLFFFSHLLCNFHLCRFSLTCISGGSCKTGYYECTVRLRVGIP